MHKTDKMTTILDFSEVNEKNNKIFHVHISLTKKKFNLRTRNRKYNKVPRISRKNTTTLSIPKVLVIAK